MYTTHIRFDRHHAYTYIHMRCLGTCPICPSTSKRGARDDGGDGGATCRRCTRPKATFELSRTFVGQRGHVVVTAPAQELTRRARQQSARWKCSGRGQEAGMLGPRGENPRASTAEVRGARTIMRASTQESAFARERRAAPSAVSNELFHDRNRG